MGACDVVVMCRGDVVVVVILVMLYSAYGDTPLVRDDDLTTTAVL